MNLVLRSKVNRRYPKMAKTKTVQKFTFMLHSLSKGTQRGQQSAGNCKTSFGQFFILSYLLMQKDCHQNPF